MSTNEIKILIVAKCLFKCQHGSLCLMRRLVAPLESFQSGNGWLAGSKVGSHYMGNCETAAGRERLCSEFPWQSEFLWRGERGEQKRMQNSKKKKHNVNSIKMRSCILSTIWSTAVVYKCRSVSHLISTLPVFNFHHHSEQDIVIPTAANPES